MSATRRAGRSRGLAATLAVASFLPGCAGAVFDGVFYDPTYSPPETGTAPVFVRPARLAETVANGLADRTSYPMAFPLPREGERPPYRLVIVFQPPRSLAPAALCGPAPLPPGEFPTAGRAEFVAAFCRGDRAMSSTAGRIPVDAPGFARGLADLAEVLFPLRAFKT